MKVGFTGTRSGMTETQRDKITALLRELSATELHHGDCIGADADAHHIAQALGIPIIIHPPSDPKARAFCEGATKTHPSKAYLTRNKTIVEQTDALVAAPYGPEQRRSGTWATIRHARKLKRSCYVVMRDGELTS